MIAKRKDSAGPKIRVAAFGKHPGWDDHIDDIGVTTDRLVWVRRVLYAEGLPGNIDSGAWEKLEEDKRLPAFRHSFFWRTQDGLIVGRMWSSRDGKGRTKYPMIVCAQCEGVPFKWAIEQVLPRLEAVEDKCVAATTADMVRLAITSAQNELDEAVKLVVAADTDSASPLRRLVDHPDLNIGEGDRLGLLRVMYEIDRELVNFRPATGSASLRPKTAPLDVRAQHLRVPRCAARVGEAAREWTALLEQSGVMKSVPILVLEPADQRFIDIIIGEPQPPVFFCIRAAEGAIPLATDVPYSLSPEFVADAKDRIEAWREGKIEPPSPAPPAPEAARAPAAAPVAHAPAKLPGQGLSSRVKILIAAGAFVVVVLAVILLIASNGSKPSPATAANTTPVPPVAPTPDPAPPKTAPPVPANPPVAQTPAAQTPLSQAPAAADDPRPSWGAAGLLGTARTRLEHLNAELAAENKPAAPGIAAKLAAAEERVRAVAGLTWNASTRDDVKRDMTATDGAIADVHRELDAGMADAAGRVRAFLAARAAENVSPDENLARAWRDAVMKIDPAGGWAAVRKSEADLAQLIQRTQTEISAEPAPEAPPAARPALDARRASALAAAARLIGDGAGAEAVGKVKNELREYFTAAGALLRDAARLETALSAGSGPTDTLEGGVTLAQVRASCERSPVFADLRATLAPIWSRFEAVAGISGESSTDALAAVLEDPARAADAPRVWRRLDALNWPATAAEFTRAARVLKSAPADVPPRCWQRFVAAHGAGDAAFDAAMNARAEFGAGEAQVAALPGVVQFNILKWTLSRDLDALAAQKPPEAALRSLVERFTARVGALDASIAPRTAGLVAALRDATRKGADIDLSKLGPGAHDWKLATAPEQDALVGYTRTLGDAEQKLEFRKLNSVRSGESVVYLCTCEVSVGLFISCTTAAGQWDRIKPMLREFDSQSEPRHGPRTWEWNPSSSPERMTIIHAAPADPGRGWINLYVAPKQPFYAPALGSDGGPSPPTRDDPMQYVSAPAAIAFAAVLGCRLPSSNEWKAAVQMEPDEGHPNVRDDRWRKQREHAAAVTLLDDGLYADVFWPAGSKHSAHDADTATDGDDGYLWFAPVATGGGSLFHHLRGNVAEFTFEDPSLLEALNPAAPNVAGVLRGGELLRVIGGSALSHPSVDKTTPQPVDFGDALRDGYSDVGFRLAFSAPEGVGAGGIEKIRKLVSGTPFLSTNPK